MFKIYSSSAGSGKTYTLTKEYIRLALHPDNDAYFRHILAVTFTNAAAAEMKDRILNTLRSFAAGENHPMLQDIVLELYPQAPPQRYEELTRDIQQRASRVFTRILHAYSDFSVMTIDSFMSRLVNSFTDELGLPYGFETRLDSDLLTEAISQLLSKIGLEGEEPLSQLLENYYLEHAREEGAWGILPKQMESVASDLLNEQSYLSMTKVSELTLNDWQQIRNYLIRFIKVHESEIEKTAGKAMESIHQAGLSATDFYQSTRGVYKYFQSKSTNSNSWDAPNSYVWKTINEGFWTAKKTSKQAENAIDGLIPVLTKCFQHIEQIRETHRGRAILYKALISQIYNLSLLNEIKRELDLLLRKNNQVHISEFNRKVMDIIVRDPVPFIFERLGDKYFHILIDEFQDTSRLQFANLLPLIDNSLASGYFNLIVGDVKQAIYRFRGGDMELLLRLSHQQSEALTRMYVQHSSFLTDRLHQVGKNVALSRLNINRRSFQEITTFNNDFFEFLAQHNEFSLEMLAEVYDEHFKQAIGPNALIGGHVEINFFEKPDPSEGFDNPTFMDDNKPDEPTDPQVNYVIELIRNLRKEGYTWRDIAILCRYKKDAAQLALWLEEENIPLVSDDSLLLSNSNYVRFLIAFIKVLYYPSHRNHRMEAALLFQNVVLKEALSGILLAEMVEMSRLTDLDSFLSFFEQKGFPLEKKELESLGLFELCEQIIARFHLSNHPVENNYLFRFLDEVLKFETTRVNHMGDFLNWWNDTGSNLSIVAPSDTDAVRITTIHKSKGLEYPVVILPFADWRATPKAGSRLWVDLESIDYPELQSEGKRLLSAAVPFTKSLLETPVEEQYHQEVDRVWIENINLTYVAFTRAVQRLYISAEMPNTPREGGNNAAAAVHLWLQKYLSEKGLWEEDRNRYILYQGRFHPSPSRSEQKTPFTLRTSMKNRKATGLSLKRNAEQIFDTENFEQRNNLLQKTKQLLIQLHSVDDLARVLQKYIATGLLRTEDLDWVETKVQRLFQQAAFVEAYSPQNKRLSSELILKGGATLEVDRMVLSEKGVYLIVLFHKGDEGVQRLKNLLRIGQTAGLKNVQGRLVDLQDELIKEVLI